MKHVLDGGAHWRHLANATEPSTCGGNAAFLSNHSNYFYYHYASELHTLIVRIN